jgi:hypothetical protein
MQQVAGLVGLRGAGKDTAATILVENGWRRVAFADALYLEVAEAFGVTLEFLQRRETKETPLEELRLLNCKDMLYVGRFLAIEEARLADAGASVPQIELLCQPRSPREILQVWGTEYRRQLYNDDYWREQVHKVIQANPGTNFVVTDVRFPDEGKLIEQVLGGRLGRVVRPSLAGANDKSLLHSSEVAMLDYPIALTFINEEGEEGMARFRAAVLQAFQPSTTAA